MVAARGDRLGGANAVGAVDVLTATTGDISRIMTETVSATDGYFGYSIAVSGTRVLVGAQLDDAGAVNAGSAFLYDSVSGNGSPLHTFHNPNPVAQNEFGSFVAILSDTAVLVGVPQYLNNDVGRAYICLIADGICPAAIDSPHGTENGQFRLLVVAMGDRFAVAAPFDGLHGTVYGFTTTTGALYQTITLTPTPTSGDYFGSSLAHVNGNLLIGAQTGGTSCVITPGAAFMYQPDGTLIRAYCNPDPTDPSYTSARFGAAVAGDGNTVLIGAPGADGSSGRAYLFDATTCALIDTLHKTSPLAGDHFGNAVALLGENFLVGAPDDGQRAAGAGAVYRFGVQIVWNLYRPLLRR